MVTGAGGSIGAELTRQVARFSPSRLLLVERSEPALYTVDRELCEAWPSLSIVPVVGDVGDRERMLAVFREHRPQVVAHAAAHKHVPLMEANAAEAVKNNMLGSQTLGKNYAKTAAYIHLTHAERMRPCGPDALGIMVHDQHQAESLKLTSLACFARGTRAAPHSQPYLTSRKPPCSSTARSR
jgi:nucleoside-diphosphate-sugar epimerase